jgi:hypothetical protein
MASLTARRNLELSCSDDHPARRIWGRLLPGDPGESEMAAETFKLVTPHMSGDAIGAFQELLNQRFANWDIVKQLDVDGDYGEQTDLVARETCHGLGLNPGSYAAGMTATVRTKICHPDKRTAAELKRADERKEWRAALRKRLASEAAGPKAAIAYGKKQVGISESPPNSNRGPKIDEWNRAVGTPPGPRAYWCGAFVNACLHAAGFPNQHFLAYCPSIEQRARGAGGGWSWHSRLADGKPGDLVLYTEPKSGEDAAHVELVVTANPFDVIGGNTSASPGSGNQTNGGCVAENRRDPNDPKLKFKGYARPPWSTR